MSPLELLKRLTANVTKTSLRTLSSGELDIAESEEKALQAISKVPHLAILDCTQYSADTKLIQDSAHAVKSNFQDAAHFLIVIDSLHTWAKRLPECGNEYESLNYAINALQGLTHALKCPVVIISERNRENMKNEGQNSGAGTRSIEYGAETVIALDRDMTVAPGVSSEVEVRAKIVKNRNGSIEDAVLLKFRGEHMRFRESDGGRK
jgi:replicative DNA helicase